MSEPFITISELTDKIGESAATSRGTAVITAACDIVRDEIEQTIYPAGTITAFHDGTGTDALLLKERPVNAVGTVLENAGTLTVDTDYRVSQTGVLFRGGSITSDNMDCYRSYWWPGRQNVEVTYEYGYATTDDVPPTLKEVALSIAARLWQTQAGNVSSETLGARRVDYREKGDEFTDFELRMFRKYKQAYTT